MTATTFLKHIKANVVKGDNVLYFINDTPEPLFGTILRIAAGDDSNNNRKRSANDDDDSNYTFSILRWTKVTSSPFSKVNFKYAASVPVIEKTEIEDEVSGNEIEDIGYVIHYKTFNNDVPYLWGVNNLRLTCDQHYKGKLPGDDDDYCFSAEAFEVKQGIILATQKKMWSVSTSQKNRKYIKMEAVSRKVFDYLHCSYWRLAEDDNNKRQRCGTVAVPIY